MKVAIRAANGKRVDMPSWMSWVANPPIYEVSPYLARTCGCTTPYSSKLAQRILCVPIHPAMTSEENRFIVAALIRCIEEVRKEG